MSPRDLSHADLGEWTITLVDGERVPIETVAWRGDEYDIHEWEECKPNAGEVIYILAGPTARNSWMLCEVELTKDCVQ